MSNLYVCKEYENMFSEGFKIVKPLEEHNKIIYNQALEDFKSEWIKRINEVYKAKGTINVLGTMCNDIIKDLKK